MSTTSQVPRFVISSEIKFVDTKIFKTSTPVVDQEPRRGSFVPDLLECCSEAEGIIDTQTVMDRYDREPLGGVRAWESMMLGQTGFPKEWRKREYILIFPRFVLKGTKGELRTPGLRFDEEGEPKIWIPSWVRVGGDFSFSDKCRLVRLSNYEEK